MNECGIMEQRNYGNVIKHNNNEDKSLIKVKNKGSFGTISTKIAYFAI
jgi:hypothetical protein